MKWSQRIANGWLISKKSIPNQSLICLTWIDSVSTVFSHIMVDIDCGRCSNRCVGLAQAISTQRHIHTHTHTKWTISLCKQFQSPAITKLEWIVYFLLLLIVFSPVSRKIEDTIIGNHQIAGCSSACVCVCRSACLVACIDLFLSHTHFDDSIHVEPVFQHTKQLHHKSSTASRALSTQSRAYISVYIYFPLFVHGGCGNLWLAGSGTQRRNKWKPDWWDRDKFRLLVENAF